MFYDKNKDFELLDHRDDSCRFLTVLVQYKGINIAQMNRENTVYNMAIKFLPDYENALQDHWFPYDEFLDVLELARGMLLSSRS